ncbi:MAG: hypothetical protein JXB34_10980 [Bacteroidales bacterium]|nr:hypothetical protein [Bacteroidales bacterium]
MGVNNVVIERLSEKVVGHIVEIIQSEKAKADKPLRKVCEQCIRYITFEKVKEEDTEKSIDIIESKLSEGNEFYWLLLAILYDDLEDDTHAFEYYEKFAETRLAEHFSNELKDFILMARFFEMADCRYLEQTGSVYIEKYSEGMATASFFHHLSEIAPPKEYSNVYLKLIEKAKQLYPDDYTIDSFAGYVFHSVGDYKKALGAYFVVKENLEKETGHPLYNLNMASVWTSIANCYLKLEDATNTLDSCGTALDYNKNSEEFSILHTILCKKAGAYLLLGDREAAREIIETILEETPDNTEALELLSKI